MKIYLAIACFILSVFLISGCAKAPKADFTTDKQEYVEGEMITITNASKDAKNYDLTVQYVFYDFSSGSIQVPTPAHGTCLISLTAFSKTGRKKSTTNKTVTILPR